MSPAPNKMPPAKVRKLTERLLVMMWLVLGRHAHNRVRPHLVALHGGDHGRTHEVAHELRPSHW